MPRRPRVGVDGGPDGGRGAAAPSHRDAGDDGREGRRLPAAGGAHGGARRGPGPPRPGTATSGSWTPSKSYNLNLSDAMETGQHARPRRGDRRRRHRPHGEPGSALPPRFPQAGRCDLDAAHARDKGPRRAGLSATPRWRTPGGNRRSGWTDGGGDGSDAVRGLPVRPREGPFAPVRQVHPRPRAPHPDPHRPPEDPHRGGPVAHAPVLVPQRHLRVVRDADQLEEPPRLPDPRRSRARDSTGRSSSNRCATSRSSATSSSTRSRSGTTTGRSSRT